MTQGHDRKCSVYEAALGLAWLGTSVGHSLLRLAKREGVETVWRAPGRRLLQWGAGPQAVQALEGLRRGFDVADAARLMRRVALRFVPCGAPQYPVELTHLELPPVGLFVRGAEEALERLGAAPRITVVGTRRASGEGLKATEAFVAALSARGVAVVSGMALGIDGRAHRAALEAGGLTVAILGCGADVVYPRGHEWLYRKISKNGLILSELPPGTAPARWTFPHRNRLLAALGDGVLVVEASVKSGALQTATCALDLGRPVFSVPGSIFMEGHGGCNKLLYDGAYPAIGPSVVAEDFLVQTRIERGDRRECAPVVAPDRRSRLSAEERLAGGGREGAVLEALAGGPSTVDGLIGRTGFSARELNAMLAALELAGTVVRAGPGAYIRAP